MVSSGRPHSSNSEMKIIEIATISFCDIASGDPSVAIVRRCPEGVAVSLSIEGNGDLEVLLDPASARKLAAAIYQGAEMDFWAPENENF
jgi:hypothetical protein